MYQRIQLVSSNGSPLSALHNHKGQLATHHTGKAGPGGLMGAHIYEALLGIILCIQFFLNCITAILLDCIVNYF